MTMKTLAILLTLALASCAAPTPRWSEFAPLDEPGHVEPTVAELHAKNIRWIIRGKF